MQTSAQKKSTQCLFCDTSVTITFFVHSSAQIPLWRVVEGFRCFSRTLSLYIYSFYFLIRKVKKTPQPIHNPPRLFIQRYFVKPHKMCKAAPSVCCMAFCVFGGEIILLKLQRLIRLSYRLSDDYTSKVLVLPNVWALAQI